MASYNARIDLEVRVKKALASVDQVEKRISQLGQVPISIEKNINKEVKSAIDSFKRLGRIVKSTGVAIAGLGGAGAIGSLATTLEKIARVDIGALGKAFGAVTKLDNALLQLVSSAPGATAALAALTAGTLAFAPQIARAAVDTLRLGKALGRAKGPLKALLDVAAVSPMAFAFGDLTKAVEAYKRELFETSETVSELSRRQKALKDNLDRFNSGSETAAKIAEKLVNVNARLNDELREQADLLRRVSGVTVTELEATKGRKSIETRKRAERFRLQQLDEENRVKEALQALDQRGISALEEKLNLQRNIVNNLDKAQKYEKSAAGKLVREQKALPAFQERGLQLLDDSVRLNESQLRIETALNGQRARGVRFLEKQAQEEKRQLDLGLTGTRSKLLNPGAASLAEQQAQAVAAAQATERLAIAQRLQRTTSGVRTELNLQLATAIKLQPAIAAITEEFERQLAIQKQGALLAGKFSPVGGSEDIPGSPAFLEARRRRRKDALSSGIIGGAFPLLFGQGAGAAVGGALGGVGGGLIGGQFGFGLSLIGTQLGSIFDQTIANAQEAGKALNSTGGALDFMREKSLFSTDAVKERAVELEELGKVEELATLLTKELVDKIGNKGVESIQKLGETTDETTRLWNELTLQLFKLISGPLNTFLKIVNNVLSGGVTRGRFEALQEDFAGNEAFKRAVREKRKARGRNAKLGALQTEDLQDLLDRAAAGEFGARPINVKIPVTPEDERRFSVTPKKDTSAERAVRERQRAEELLQKLQQQLKATKVIGSSEEKRLQIQTEYLNTVNAIDKLKDKTYDTELRSTAESIKKNKEEQLTARLAGERTEAIRQAVAPIVKIRKAQEISAEKIKEYNRLLMEGVLPSEAERIISFNEQVRLSLELIDLEIQRAKAAGLSSKALQEQLEKLEAQKDAIESEALKGPGEAVGTTPREKIESRVAEIRGELTELANLGNFAVTVADNIGGAFQSAFRDVITGSKSTQEALADMFGNIAEAFASMAAEIIAKQLVMIALQGILKALGAVSAAAAPSAPAPKDGAAFQGIGTSTLDSLGGEGPISDPKGLFTPPTLVSKKAAGGPVANNVPYLVGEEGPELFVPFQNGIIVPNGQTQQMMNGAFQSGGNSSTVNNSFQQMQVTNVPFTRSAEQASVIAAEQETAKAIRNPGPIDVRYESQVINGVEYVTAEQHQKGMAQAADRGRALTLASLQNSVKARRRIGL